jgi:hypothetical protein
LSKPYPAINSFDVSLPAVGSPAFAKVRPYVVRVSQFDSAAAYETRKLIYKSRNGQLLEDFYNELIAPPARLLADSLATRLDLTSPNAQFVRSQGQRGADFVLEGFLAELLGDFSQEPPVARIVLSVTLNDVRRDKAQILLARTYQAQVTFDSARDRPAPELMKALTQAWGQILLSLEQDLGESFSGLKKSR